MGVARGLPLLSLPTILTCPSPFYCFLRSDPERGFAWTRALLGSRCKEIHVCGGMEVSASQCDDDRLLLSGSPTPWGD
jgi:hypothetical protein